MANKIKCADCCFPFIDKQYSDKKWTAYVCGNPESECYKSVLNINCNGGKLDDIVWSGCKHGKRRVSE